MNSLIIINNQSIIMMFPILSKQKPRRKKEYINIMYMEITLMRPE